MKSNERRPRGLSANERRAAWNEWVRFVIAPRSPERPSVPREGVDHDGFLDREMGVPGRVWHKVVGEVGGGLLAFRNRKHPSSHGRRSAKPVDLGGRHKNRPDWRSL